MEKIIKNLTDFIETNSDKYFAHPGDRFINRNALLDHLKQLKSSLTKPVEVPEVVAEWYEENKDYPLSSKFMKAQHAESEKIQNWYDNCKGRHANKRANAQEIIAKMDLYGYTVVKEPLYYVRLKNTILTDSNHCYLWLNQSTDKVFFEQKNIKWTNEGNVKNTFSEKEIAEISDGVFVDNKAFELVPVEEEEK